MACVVIVSLPLVVFFILLSFGCYFMGREKGRKEGTMEAQMWTLDVPSNGVAPRSMHAIDVPPPGGPHPGPKNPYFTHLTPQYPNPTNIMQENVMNA
ncbi:hypothetical protein MRB53_020849 [Persea americana]|uniref:Uncharacterized protein n=1 Tax=Persea americana TaxID=3435 RepID=A0ACC2L380_PERAE|nr:hypothetical protein MRB53_020849 [Persea americana]